ncbi:MAG: hypothetical protein HZA01_14890 [Nitrospinae bacterium]|nr:hypothetical protein [Nitrospinota bacterium]
MDPTHGGFGGLLCAIDWHVETPYTVAIVGAGDADGVRSLIRATHQELAPNKIIVAAESPEMDLPQAVADLLVKKGAVDGKAAAYVCHKSTCSAPVVNGDSLQALLRGN